MRPDCIFFESLRVREDEVDRQGIVYNGRYASYADVSLTSFFRSKGYPYKQIVEDTGLEIVTAKSSFEFYASAFEEDLLDIGIRVIRIGNKSLTIGFEIYRHEEDEMLVYSEHIFSGYDPASRKSHTLPDPIRKILES